MLNNLLNIKRKTGPRKGLIMKDNINYFKTSGIKKWFINFLISFVIFLLFLFIVELVLRTTHLFGAKIGWSEKDTVLGYRFIPNSKYWTNKENDHPITGRINSHGWRDKEWILEKPPNTYRIAVLGDSMVEAMQVELDRTFLSLAEHQLNEYHKINVELMNFGCSGYSQPQELIVLKHHVMRFLPDMVIVFFVPQNDIRDVSKETAPELLRPFYTLSEKEELKVDTNFVTLREFKNKSGFRKYSALISLIAERYNSYQQQLAIKKKSKTIGTSKVSKWEVNNYLSLCTLNQDTTYLKNYQLNKVLIKAMVENCKEKGIKFMLVTVDFDAYIPEIEEKYRAIDPTFNANYFEDDLRSYAASLNIEYMGLQRLFRKTFENTKTPLRWGHWNYKGHQVVADELVGKLKSIIAPIEEW